MHTHARLMGSVVKTDMGLTASGGSNPSSTAIVKQFNSIIIVYFWRNTQVWLKGSVLKTDRSLTARGGSNPSSSAINIINAGWSSSVARRAHNPKVGG